MHVNLKIQEENLRRLLETGAFQFVDEQNPWFPYTSGQIGPYYVQSINIEKDGEAYASAIESLVQLIREWRIEFDVISGGETRDWDFSSPCAVALRKPHLKIYKDGRMLGAEVKEQRILHVADLNNEGSSVRDYWHPLTTRRGGRIVGVMAFVDRMEEGVKVINDLGLPLAAVAPLDARAWQVALDGGFVTGETHTALLERQRDPTGWALERLRRHPSLLLRIFDDPRTRAKALKIIDYYKQFDPELERLLK